MKKTVVNRYYIVEDGKEQGHTQLKNLKNCQLKEEDKKVTADEK